MGDMEQGQLTTNGVHLKAHELETVRFFLGRGQDVELIPAVGTNGQRTADILMGGVVWEMKSPEGDGKNNMRNTFQNAAGQSNSIIIDLRRSKLSTDQCLKELKWHFGQSKRVRRLSIITKENLLVELSRG